MSYATKQAFGGQRATVGRTVLVGVGLQLGSARRAFLPGVIETIDEDLDQPTIRTSGGALLVAGGGAFRATTAEDVDKLVPGEWTWPPRV